MLPCTPLQYLLFHQAAGRPRGVGWLSEPQPLVLVMTSANAGGEPLIAANAEALARLGAIADAFVLHDRDIVVRCDDSVVRASGNGPAFIRRARGYTPAPIRLARAGPPVLALGGYFKNTVCVTRGDEAFLSQHVGDLDNPESCHALEEAVGHLLRTLDVEPAVVAHDLHPDFHGSRYAAAFAAQRGLPALAVQHHHAHIAAVAAEHRLRGPLLGLALDGVGLGSDKGIWGGELLRVETGSVQRIAHLRELRLPGGDRAAREPWRMAASALFELGRVDEIERRFAGRGGAILAQMLARGLNSPPTSSAGRWFDAAAGLLGVREICSYEGQAAMLLEGLAEAHGPAAPADHAYAIGADGTLDLLPLLAHLAGQRDRGYGAAVFHSTLAAALAAWVRAASERTGVAQCRIGWRLFHQPHPRRGLARVPGGRGAGSVRGAAGAVQRRRAGAGAGGSGPGKSGRLSMCLAIPALVVRRLEAEEALIDAGGIEKRVSLALVPEAAIGDYVVVHAGYALSRVDPEEARLTLALFAEMQGAA